jgi:hypothetical protein
VGPQALDVVPQLLTELLAQLVAALAQRLGAALLALGIAFTGSYLVVVSQNPASSVSGSPTDYGPIK